MKLAPTALMTLALALLGACVAADDTEPTRTGDEASARTFRLLLHFGAEQRSCAGASVDSIDIYVDGDLLSSVPCSSEPIDVALPTSARLVEVLGYRVQPGGPSWLGEVTVTKDQPAALIELSL